MNAEPKSGDKIRFTHRIKQDADDHSPAMLFALPGDIGEVVSVRGSETYPFVVAGGTRNFCVARDEFELIEEIPK